MISRRKNKLIIFIGIPVSFCALYIGLVWLFPGFFPSFGMFVGNPFWIITKPVSSLSSHFRSVSQLNKENESLKRDLDRIELTLANYRVIEEENQRIRELFSGNREESLFVLGSVLLGPSKAGYDKIVVSLPKDSDVSIGSDVYASQTVSIGKVSELYGSSVVIKLYSNPDDTLDAVFSSSGTPVTLQGLGGGSFFVDMPKDADVAVDDVLILPGTVSVIGFVRGIEENPDQTLKRVLVSLPVNIFSLQEVFIKK